MCGFWIKEFADLVTFTEEVLNGKVNFLCSVCFEYSAGEVYSSKFPTTKTSETQVT